MSIFKDILGWDFPCVPHRNTIENWVKKCGYDIYKDPPEEIKSESYAEILDESFMIGGQKMLLTLGVNANKTNATPVTHKDIHILKMSVSSSWNGWNVWSNLRDTENRIGHPPEYIISDNACSLGNGIRRMGYTHIRDVSHTLGLLMKHLYEKDKEFIGFTTEVQNSKVYCGMLNVGYLVPPKQRAIARFMNMSNYVNWAMKMLRKFSRLSDSAKKAYAFIPQYALLIKELYKSVLCVNHVQKEIISKGLSDRTLEYCLPHICRHLTKGTPRMKILAQQIIQYIQDECYKMKNKEKVWNASSDIIESVFGLYKSKKASNPLYGITSFVLFLPLYVHLGREQQERSFDFKSSLENIYIKDIEIWKKKNLRENLVIKRRNVLKYNVNTSRKTA